MDQGQFQTLHRAFALTLRDLREGAGLSQEALAYRSGLDRSYISLLERNQRQPTINTLLAIATAFDLSLSQLASRIEETMDAN